MDTINLPQRGTPQIQKKPQNIIDLEMLISEKLNDDSYSSELKGKLNNLKQADDILMSTFDELLTTFSDDADLQQDIQKLSRELISLQIKVILIQCCRILEKKSEPNNRVDIKKLVSSLTQKVVAINDFLDLKFNIVEPTIIQVD